MMNISVGGIVSRVAQLIKISNAESERRASTRAGDGDSATKAVSLLLGRAEAEKSKSIRRQREAAQDTFTTACIRSTAHIVSSLASAVPVTGQASGGASRVVPYRPDRAAVETNPITLPDPIGPRSGTPVPIPIPDPAERASTLPVPHPAHGIAASAHTVDTFDDGDPRASFRPGRHYSGVRLQQGRVLLDDDQNRESSVDPGDDSHPATIDLQNAQAKQQRPVQVVSNLLRMLRDRANAIIRNLR
jgi:hypothetical protein